MKYAKPDLVKTVAPVQRSVEIGVSCVVASLATRERHVTSLVSGVLLECATEDVVRISGLTGSDASVLLVSLGKDVSKVCVICKLVSLASRETACTRNYQRKIIKK